MLYNKTSAGLMLRTILLLVQKTDPKYVPMISSDDVEQCSYGIYGCFSRAYPWTEHRPDSYFPQPVEFMAIKYPVYTRQNRNEPLMFDPNNKDQIQKANLDANGPFYFISHGFLEKGSEKWIKNMAYALLDISGNDAATVIVVDWRGGSQPPYGQAVANIRLVGVMTAHLIHNIYEVLQLSNVDNFHFIGHSLGSHLGGYCGHELQKKFNLKLGRITGLDPAGPHFSKTVTLVRLDRSDAKFVDIIHSNAQPLFSVISDLVKSGFGIVEAIGHVDFYPNGGVTQPGCKQSLLSASTVEGVGCDHQRSLELFTESIGNACPFTGIQCPTYDEFLAGKCISCDNKHFCIPMGYHSYNIYKHYQIGGLIDTNTNITLYLLTGSTKPYCRKHYNVVMKLQNSNASKKNDAEYGNVKITLVDKNKNKSESITMNNEEKYYHPGETETRMLSFRDTENPPLYVIVEFFTHAFSFRLSTPDIYVEYIKLSSIEHNTEITVCPKMRKPILDKVSVVMKTTYCQF